MEGKFSLKIDVNLRKKVKSTAALNDFKNMNEFIVQAISEKIEKIENQENEKENKATV